MATNPLHIKLVAALAAAAAVSGTPATAEARVAERVNEGAWSANPLAYDGQPRTRALQIHYTAHTGEKRAASVLVPTWYAQRGRPPLPLVISPHGRGVTGYANARLWGDLPGVGGFVVVSPDGQGNRYGSVSWGAGGQIDDLARMPAFLERELPWLRIDRRRIYAFGGSMGGQETLLLAARHPSLLAGAAAFDAVTDFARQYRNLPDIPCDAACLRRYGQPRGVGLQGLVRREVGGTPETAAAAFAARSPLTLADRIAASCVPLQIWWSREDEVVRQPAIQSGRFFTKLRQLNPAAPVEAFVGSWVHTAVFKSTRALPLALSRFGLMPARFDRTPRQFRHVRIVVAASGCRAADEAGLT